MGYKYSDYTKSFFDPIGSDESAYIAGFIAADGYMNKPPKRRIEIRLSRKDLSILKKIKKSLQLNNKIYLYKRRSREYCRLAFENKKIYESLESYGIKNDKTKNLQIPDLETEHLNMSFLRGIFDGDGSIYQLKNGSWGVAFRGSKQVIDHADKLLNFNTKPYEDKHGCWMIKTKAQKRVKRITNTLYKDAQIYLDRKYNKVQQLNKEFNY